MYGHDLGDEVLIRICSLIKKNSRPTDYVIRFGGEEIDVLLPSTTTEGAIQYTGKILTEASALSFSHDTDNDIRTTLSAGISSMKLKISGLVNMEELEKKYRKIQKQSDDALYEAKFLGKNRYCIYSSKKTGEYSEIRRKYSRTA